MIEKWQHTAIEAAKISDHHPAWVQNVLLAEIALQLAKLNETLTDMAKEMSAVNLSNLGQ